MPARPPVPNVLEVAMHGIRGAKAIANLFHFRYSGTPPTDAQCATLAADLLAAFATGDGTVLLHTLMDADTEFVDCVVKDLSSVVAGAGEYVSNVVGNRTGLPLPASASVLVDHSDPLHRRAGHPRKYFPFGTANDIQNSQTWAAALTNETSAWYLGWLHGAVGITVGGTTVTDFGYVSYVDAKVPRTVPLYVPLSTGSYAVDARICSQRRRLGKGS